MLYTHAEHAKSSIQQSNKDHENIFVNISKIILNSNSIIM